MSWLKNAIYRKCLLIDQKQQIDNSVIKTKEEVLSINDRVQIDTPSLKGSINLQGAILDDLVLLKYKESLEDNSKYINLFDFMLQR